jgi:hypothetical protein
VPYYYFEAAAADGQIQKKILKARDKKDADSRLRDSGLRPMLIESARLAKRKKEVKALHTRRIVRNTVATVAGISLVGGIAVYLVLLDVNASEGPDVPMLTRSGIISQTSNMIYAETQDERDFARQLYSLWETSFPDSVSGIEIKHKGLLLIYLKPTRRSLRKDDLRVTTTALALAFQRKFETSTCILMVVKGDMTIAESRCSDGEVDTLVY